MSRRGNPTREQCPVRNRITSPVISPERIALRYHELRLGDESAAALQQNIAAVDAVQEGAAKTAIRSGDGFRKSADPTEAVVRAFARQYDCEPDELHAEFTAPSAIDKCALCTAMASASDAERWGTALNVTNGMRADETLAFFHQHGLGSQLSVEDVSYHRLHYDPEMCMTDMVLHLTKQEYQRCTLLQQYQFVTLRDKESGNSTVMANAAGHSVLTGAIDNFVKLSRLYQTITHKSGGRK
ncbi:ORF61 [Ranid herpesvirus 1]|uniref:ORF61 n=1 Tax=Ranid herpesvirus 1 TaxID=85655 RepID=Q14VP7_9VIRU|nr:ORF61 [Ranid herpesvirus 1]ABG25786.1 ORF61 [Ranid herpesvirus 1]